MKKLGLIKKCSVTAVSLALGAAMLVPGIGAAVQPGAYADVAVQETNTIVEGVSLQNTCDYGEKFKVPGTNAKVVAPDGTEVAVESGEVLANQIGNYTVTYTQGNVSYDFDVKVRLDEEFSLNVRYNGATIPSYMQVGSKITLPTAKVQYYDDDKILCDYPGNATVTIADSLGNTYEPGAEYTAPSTTSKVYLTYTARLDNGSKHLSKTYTVNVQSSVQQKGNPTLKVSGVQKDVSVNRPVTLPTATATDTYDDNVQVVVNVTDPDGKPVKNVNVDDDGYAVSEKETDVEFDNDKNMTFYPTKTGVYTVTYQAFNDLYDGTPNGVGQSSLRTYKMTVSDLAAPVFKNVDEYLIPETWGLDVKKLNENGNEVSVEELGGKIRFTVPEVVDNKDHMPVDANDTSDTISIYFRITDADKSKTVVEFQNILTDESSDSTKYTATSSSSYKVDAQFCKGHDFVFDFNQYNKKTGDEAVSLTGNYTVLFRARDKANNTSSKTYNITLQDTFVDRADPTTAEVTVPDYLAATETEFTVPYPEYADAADTRPYVDYRIYTDAANANPAYIEAKGGEEAELKTENSKRYLVVGDKKLELGSALYFYVGVTDKVGNFTSNVKADGKSVDLSKENATVDFTQFEDVMKIVGGAAEAQFDYKAGIEFNNADKAKGKKVKAGESVNAGGFVITTDADMRDYTGFEVAVKDPNGNTLTSTLETLSYVKDDVATIIVQNITFNAPVSTEAAAGEDAKYYTVTVRVFDVDGRNNVYGYTMTGVEPNSQNNAETSAIPSIGTSGNVNVSYKLNNSVIKGIPSDDDSRFFVVRKISGGTFSLMGNEFNAKSQGKYTVQDGYINEKNIASDNSFVYGDVKFGGANNGVYNFGITDVASPVIELQDTMPTYAEKYIDSSSSELKLPVAIAYTDNGMAEVEVTVKDPDAHDVEVTDYKFKATKDGAYTVTYTATYGNASPTTATYTINVGDVFAPPFTVDTTGRYDVNRTARVGDAFTFGKMVLDSTEDTANVTVTKKLIDPSKNEVSSATVTGSYTNNKDKEDNGTDVKFDMAGEYEVVYTAKDAAGNEYVQRYTITVVSSGSSSPTTWTTLSTVLIIVAVVLLAGVIVYVVRFRKVKK